MTARAEFLERVRREVGRSPGLFRAETASRPGEPGAAAEAVRRQMAERWREALERFREEFERVAGVFHRAEGWDEAVATISGIARAKGVRELVSWDPAALGFDPGPALAAKGLAVAAAPVAEEQAARLAHRARAAGAGIGITGADVAIAQTGTLVLLSGQGRPRSTSLLPETHVAVFGRDRLVESLEQVGILLEALHQDAARSMSGAAIAFITGPSRTADIELTLTRGVHGPKEVHAIFVEGA